jgi:hypothetical protein
MFNNKKGYFHNDKKSYFHKGKNRTAVLMWEQQSVSEKSFVGWVKNMRYSESREYPTI